jgi:hypothetical protein
MVIWLVVASDAALHQIATKSGRRDDRGNSHGEVRSEGLLMLDPRAILFQASQAAAPSGWPVFHEEARAAVAQADIRRSGSTACDHP